MKVSKYKWVSIVMCTILILLCIFYGILLIELEKLKNHRAYGSESNHVSKELTRSFNVTECVKNLYEIRGIRVENLQLYDDNVDIEIHYQGSIDEIKNIFQSISSHSEITSIYAFSIDESGIRFNIIVST